MNTDMWLALGVTASMVAALVRNVAGPDTVFVAGTTALMLMGLLSVDEAFLGLANPGVLTVAVLFSVAAGVRETGALDLLGRRMLGRPRGLRTATARLVFPAAAVSAFLNNTPLVAMMVPLVTDWARSMRLPGSKLLMPLSFAAILGGTCTLIGTSTNLIIAGLVTARVPDLRLGIFELSLVGVPLALLGAGYLTLLAPTLLPDRSGVREALERVREYSVPMRVEPGSPVVGRSIEEAGLRHLPGLYLAQIQRHGETLTQVGPDTRLAADDVLVFVGVVDSVVDLRKVRGLVAANDEVGLLRSRLARPLVEAVVAAGSPLVDLSVRDARFRTHYSAAIVAVHRDGQRLVAKIGDIVLHPGDTLLLEADPSFVRTFRNDSAFALVSEVENSAPPRHDRAWIALSLLAAMVLASAFRLVPLLTAALLTTGALIVTRCISAQDARRAIDTRVVLAIAAAFGVGRALENTGAAQAVAETLVGAARPLGSFGAVLAVYAATSLLSTFIANNAAAVLMFPIATGIAESAGLPVRGVVYVLMLAASLNFATPIGYQTNLMVYGPGGYRFGDFLRLGLPLQVLLGLAGCGLCWLYWF